MNGLITVIFVTVYAGMFLGRLPWLRLDRTGVAVVAGFVPTGGVSDCHM